MGYGLWAMQADKMRFVRGLKLIHHNTFPTLDAFHLQHDLNPGYYFHMETNQSLVLLLSLVRQMSRLTRRKERLVHQPFEAASGFHIKTFHALYLIANGTCLPGEIVRELGVPNSTTTRLVDNLVAEGLVQRQSNPEDLRQIRLSLTPAGKARYEIAWAQYLTCLHTGLGQLPEAALQQAVTAMNALESALDSEPDNSEPVHEPA